MGAVRLPTASSQFPPRSSSSLEWPSHNRQLSATHCSFSSSESTFSYPAICPVNGRPIRVSFAIIAISAVIVAPLVEEIFFRGFMYQALRRTMAILPAALLTSLVFGIAHTDPAIIIPIALVGMILLGIYRWTGNLWSSIITHAGYNAVAVAALAIQTWGA